MRHVITAVNEIKEGKNVATVSVNGIEHIVPTHWSDLRNFTGWKIRDDWYSVTLDFEGYSLPFYMEKPALPEPVRFQGIEASIVTYNNGIGNRNRQCRLMIYTRNRIWDFDGSDIPGIAMVIGTPDYTRKGKWSNTTYKIQLAAGVKASYKMQNFDSGKYVDNHTSINSIKKELELDGCDNYAVEEFLKRNYVSCYVRYIDHIENLRQLEDAADRQNSDIVTYTFIEERISKRQGKRKLLINGVVFDGEEMEGVKIVSQKNVSGYGGGQKIYELMILTSMEVEELPEYSPYSPEDDSLESRGYEYKDGKWVV